VSGQNQNARGGGFDMAEYSAGLVHAAADRAKTRANKVHPAPPWHERVFTAAALKGKVFEPISYVIHDLMPDGLSMLVGRPKIGKSWLALEAALAVASKDGTCLGGRKVEHGNVLYCACEDSERRLQSRITKLIGVHKSEWPEDLKVTGDESDGGRDKATRHEKGESAEAGPGDAVLTHETRSH
jgi:AAA domain